MHSAAPHTLNRGKLGIRVIGGHFGGARHNHSALRTALINNRKLATPRNTQLSCPLSLEPRRAAGKVVTAVTQEA